MLTRDKIRGFLVGGAIGDALGRPVECMSFDEARRNYPDGIKEYLPPNNNKWFKDEKVGVITDDTQLSLAVLKSIIRSKGFSMSLIAKYHVLAMNETIEGWAPTTREAVERLSEGVSWKQSGITKNKNRGAGNGVLMKISPLAALYAVSDDKWFRFADKLVKFSQMTHFTRNSAVAGIVHVMTMAHLLWSDISYFTKEDLWKIIQISLNGKDFKRDKDSRDHYYFGDLPKTNADYPEIADNLNFILPLVKDSSAISVQELVEKFKNGDSQVINSLPFSYAFFLKNPYSIETLYNVAWMGGDADTNAKIVGEMLGALNGLKFFEDQPHLINGLKNYNQLINVADAFCDTFEVEA